jgi:DNA processing protein
LSWCCEIIENMFKSVSWRLLVSSTRGTVRAPWLPAYAGPVEELSVSEERAALIALLRGQPGSRRWPEVTADVLEAGSALEVFGHLEPGAMMADPRDTDLLRSAAADLREWARQGHRFVTILDAEYPQQLRGIHQAPPFLFVRGDLRRIDPAVSVVGSRKASEQGLSIARDVARGLVARKLAVVSGLARGIDTAAHEATL